MGNSLNCDCDTRQTHSNNSLQKLTKQLEIYANENYIMQFDRPIRQVIEKLFVLNQSHVSDKIIELHRNKNQQEKQKMLQDLSRIDLQQMDQICHVSQNSAILRKINKHAKTNNFTPIIRIGYEYVDSGEHCLRQSHICLIVTVQCFHDEKSNIDPLQKTNLISQKSRLELFLDKVDALRQRYHSNCQVFIICPQKLTAKIKELSTDAQVNVIAYQPQQPCITSDSKIVLYGNQILFNYQRGDFLHFLYSCPQLKNCISRSNFINLCDLNNFISPAINPAQIGYLSFHNNLSILASLKCPADTLTNVPVCDGFIENQSYQFGDIIIKTSMLREMTTKSNNLYQSLNARIQRKLMHGYTDCYYFSRLPSDILYKEWTQVVRVPCWVNNQAQYSRYCKSILGLQDQGSGDIAEVSPAVLHGDPKELDRIRAALRERTEQFSYPIVIMKSKEE